MPTPTTLYPPPRWFREAVQEWLDAHQAAVLPHRIADLWTRVANSTPPDLRLVHDRDA